MTFCFSELPTGRHNFENYTIITVRYPIHNCKMTSPDLPLTYASFCGSVLDDMLEQVIHSIVSNSLLNEKLIRKNYGTVSKPIFHDPPFFVKKNDQTPEIVCIDEVTEISTKKNRYEEDDDEEDDEFDDDENDDYGSSNSRNNKNKPSQIDLTSDDEASPKKRPNRKNRSLQYKEPDIGRFQFTLNGKDIYVNALNDNRKLLGPKADAIVIGGAQDLYFKCSNCDRKIAGSRFGAHIDKCLGGRSRK